MFIYFSNFFWINIIIFLFNKFTQSSFKITVLDLHFGFNEFRFFFSILNLNNCPENRYINVSIWWNLREKQNWIEMRRVMSIDVCFFFIRFFFYFIKSFCKSFNASSRKYIHAVNERKSRTRNFIIFKMWRANKTTTKKNIFLVANSYL